MILVSAGHHPYRKGTHFKDVYEYDVAIEWAANIVSLIDTNVMLVPPGLLRHKVAFINKQPDTVLAVEIHFNSAPDWDGGGNRGDGCETLYCPGSKKGKQAAEHVQNAMAAILPPDRGIKEGWYRMEVGGTPNYFLKHTKCPALIIEPAFIEDVPGLRGQEADIFAAIAQGILQAAAAIH